MLQINRCVRCAESGTFALDPSMACQPCVHGGSCEKGLLQPQEGYWSYNPLVPQMLPCPLKGACINRDVSLHKDSMAWAAGLQGAGSDAGGSGSSGSNSSNSSMGGARRQLLQQGSGTGTSNRAGSMVLGVGSAAQPDRVLSRSAALLEFNTRLASLMTFDPEQGTPMLLNMSMSRMLEGWHEVQCSKG